ncbi:MAG: Asp-tRNAAsn/Glu-tRNAGln amidotransferase B subunit, GatB [Candidatus Methanohalarchaeum thermophilum]|uniref:Aspartyl/glutamyl-tRNA(Asn/Gln) amidotransferase subunit B n=1 Tax=Methanohalarchaeum thermophilum TaxID=1903181 RepID=A0A1Q6DW60_METT1|nr:MAG: Asp-tRNAAsn/Glu-tRNAGln amidotransferase B subunit, GatB [Candidatus Methanohalarchaeum thermophilum]
MDIVIGLEVHIQLQTNTKLFCGCSTNYRDSKPNKHTCPICLGLPGSLPKLNQKALEYGIKAGLALDCNIADSMQFHRKNYFYPDLPKGFQISQYDSPLATEGTVELSNGKKIEIRRIHLEEDPGRLEHPAGKKQSYVDYNRSGVPLLEIVTEPDMSSPQEARDFLRKIREIMEYLKIFDGGLEGSLRCDANISIEGGGRAEVKNISSYKGAEKALNYEITRQKNLMRRGKEVKRETRHFNEEQGITKPSREKEEEHDYRYFPEPDLPRVTISKEKIKEIEESLPELPDEKRDRFQKEYGLSQDQAESLTTSLFLADFYEEIACQIDPELTATWVADTLKGELSYRGINLKESNIEKEDLLFILRYLKEDEITEKGAIKVMRSTLDENKKPEKIIEEENLRSISLDEISEIAKRVIKENPEAIEDYRQGKEKAVNYLVGQVMKETNGRADPGETNKLIQKQLEEID